MKILNIYGQYSHHTDARIIGNRAGLTVLRDTINNALSSGQKAKTLQREPLFASDGEGYSVLVECHADEWGIKGGKDSFWNTEESNPQYIMYIGLGGSNEQT